MAIEYENGDSDLTAVQLKQALPSDPWLSMQQDWGAVWKRNSDSPFRAPLSIMLTEGSDRNGKTVVTENVIPADWKPGNTYRSAVNFKTL
ncbi:hypothetical protein L6164_000717 [Bauhinia variegata]|nr:hypothetical protein L6164_000717 [Bauhinia variegata]